MQISNFKQLREYIYIYTIKKVYNYLNRFKSSAMSPLQEAGTFFFILI